MKKFVILASLLVSSAAFSAQTTALTFNKMILKKESQSNAGIFYVANKTVTAWCTGSGSPMSIGTFEAAQTIDGLSDALYSCEGKFVQVPGQRINPIQIFEVTSCTAVSSVELQTECPTPAPKL